MHVVVIDTCKCNQIPPDVPESLLACRVPDLKLDAFAWFDLDQTGEEVYANSRIRHLCKTSFCEASDQTRLPHRRVANDNQPELVQPYSFHILFDLSMNNSVLLLDYTVIFFK